MNSQDLAVIDSRTLAHRLGELCAKERRLQLEFLRHLDEFDRRRAYLELGFGSLWEYCLKALHLREGATGRRIGAMRVVRRLPKLADPLGDGRLCLSTLALLGPHLTDDNLDELLQRASYRSKAEVDHLVASLQPRQAPKEGIRKLVSSTTVPSRCDDSSPALEPPAQAPTPTEAAPHVLEPPRPRSAQVQPVSEQLYSLRATISRACKQDLDQLALLLSHKIAWQDLGEVLHEAIRCALAKHGRRKGALEPSRPCPSTTAPLRSSTISAEMRRRVWKRDGGGCAFIAEDGTRCQSRFMLEVDHIVPKALGGESTFSNLRLTCKPHNLLHAERVYGREHMAKFRRQIPAISRDSETHGRSLPSGP